ncbi:hypothetical protein Tco_0834947 [Tanacetum coccineum]
MKGYSEWNGTVAKDEFHVSAVRVTYYWQVYFMLLVAFNIVVKIKNVEPIKQKWVKDETIIKEWENRMERAATTASSLEEKQDSGNINRIQSMATLNKSFPQGTNSERELVRIKLQKQVLDLEEAKTAQAKEIASLKKRVKQLEKRKKLRTSRLKRLRKVGSTNRVESSNDVSLGAQEDASKQGRKIADLNVDAEPIVNAAKTTSSIPVSVADPVTTAGEVVTTASATTIVDELNLAKIVEPEKPSKKKDQIALDEELALRLHAEEQAELERMQKEKVAQEEASRVAIIEELDSIKAMIEADEQLAARLQAKEQE